MTVVFGDMSLGEAGVQEFSVVLPGSENHGNFPIMPQQFVHDPFSCLCVAHRDRLRMELLEV